jgi:hypothetical protein
VESMLEPKSLALIGGTLVIWVGSHAFGVGEVVDAILLGVGVIALGFSVFEGAKAFKDFAVGAVRARSEADLDEAGRQFARAVVILGIDAYGVIQVARSQTLTEQRLTLLHELVHRFFSSRTGPLRRLRAELSMSAYARSAILRHIEEALAEGYAQLRINGLNSALQAYRFPLSGGYVTVSQLAAEGQAIGTIVMGGIVLHVSISRGSLTSDP